MFMDAEQRLRDFSIKVSYVFSKLRFYTSKYATCAEVAKHAKAGTSTSYTCRVPLIGRFVVVQVIARSRYMTLCEVRVFATAGKFTTVLLVAIEVRDFATAGKFTTVLLVAIEVRDFATAGKFTTVLLVANEVRDFATAGKFTTVLLVAIEVRDFATAGKFTTVLLVANEVRVFATAGKFTTVLLVARDSLLNAEMSANT